MLKVTALLALVAFATASIEPSLLESLKTNEKANILVTFVGGNTAVVNSIEVQSFATRTNRINALKLGLERQAEISQRSVQTFLQENSVPFRSFWISNQISIKGATKEVIHKLSQFAEVEEVIAARKGKLDRPIPGQSVARQNDVEWGVARIQADQAWAMSNGTGAIVANIDTGVRYTHEALRGNWVDDGYGWFEPTLFTEFPNDPNSHGTHTMGIMAGTHGIGVAPGAKWMACSVRNDFDTDDLLDCGQWILCPTLYNGLSPDCSKAPDVCSNSWSSGAGYDPWFEGVTEAWVAAGIIPTNSGGNTGSTCGSAVRSPGCYRRVISAGSTNVGHRLSTYSSVGPGPNGRVKPTVSAPGEDIRSSMPGSDTSYAEMSGTSMASPHVAGLVALIRSAKPDATYAQIRQALIDGVFNDDLITRNATCAGINDSSGYPNHHFGSGQINAFRTIQNVINNM